MVVADSSTLILLAKAGLLDYVLERSKEKVFISPVVYTEIVSKKESDDGQLIKKRTEEQQLIIHTPKQKGMSNRLQGDFNLGKGEAEAIALCLEKKEALMTDDKKAILACKAFHIPFITALNLLVALRHEGLTKELSLTIFKRLQDHGRYSKELIKKAEEDLQ